MDEMHHIIYKESRERELFLSYCHIFTISLIEFTELSLIESCVNIRVLFDE
jgi:hypothetical protein